MTNKIAVSCYAQVKLSQLYKVKKNKKKRGFSHFLKKFFKAASRLQLFADQEQQEDSIFYNNFQVSSNRKQIAR